MFDALKEFVSEFVGQREPSRTFADDDIRLATAALLVQVADSDGHYGKRESARAQALVADRFQLDSSKAAQLIREALQRDHEEVSVELFVKVLKRALEMDARLKVIAMMWDIVFADGKVNDAEESVVWRIADMLGVSPADQDTLRRSRIPDNFNTQQD